MKLFKFVLLTALFVSVNCHAEGIADGLDVYTVRVDDSGLGYVWFSGDLTGTPPACAITHPKHLAFDTNTPGGQAILSLLLSAKMSGKKIRAVGTGTCEGYDVVERWKN